MVTTVNFEQRRQTVLREKDLPNEENIERNGENFKKVKGRKASITDSLQSAAKASQFQALDVLPHVSRKVNTARAGVRYKDWLHFMPIPLKLSITWFSSLIQDVFELRKFLYICSLRVRAKHRAACINGGFINLFEICELWVHIEVWIIIGEWIRQLCAQNGLKRKNSRE